MLPFKYQYALLAIAIFCLCNQECYCDQEEGIEESNHTLLTNKTEEILNTSDQEVKFNTSEQEDLKRNINISSSRRHHYGIKLASWRWHEVGVYYTVSLFIVITGLSKVAFHHAKWLSAHVPESCLLIIVGIFVGSIIYAAPPVGDVAGVLPTFTPTLFFFILLPPVILESAYSLYNATFYENLATILLFAVVGTIFNTFAIGLILYGLDSIDWMGNWCPQAVEQDELFTKINLAELLIFSALISAVDPVAVLAIFQEVGVNKDLYFLIFGESLLNDAITVVLYNTMVATASKPSVDGLDITMAVLSFFTVNFGGVAVGIVFGLITAIITKTTSDVRVVEPLAVLGMAYLAYLTAELFHFSGIICIIFCGLLQAHYSFRNISSKSCVTVKYFIKMVSSTCEAIIFLFLGIVLLSYHHDFSSGFIYWSLLLCFIIRFIGVFVLTTIANVYRVKRIQLQEQLITAYGGLRGAVGFSLVIMLSDQEAKAKNVYVTTTLVVILFTVFVQGSTIKPLVKLLDIEISGDKHKTLIGEIHDQVTSHLMAGIEEIIGFRWNFYLKRKMLDLDEKYLHKIFLRDKSDNRIRHVFEKASLNHHYAHLYGPVTLIEDHKSRMLNSGQPSGPSAPPPTKHIPFVAEQPALSDIFSGVELRRKDGTEIKPKLLRKAFQSNPFHKYIQRYNPNNFIDDDNHGVAAQLELRRQRANRITQAVIEPSRGPDQHLSMQEDSEERIGNLGGRLGRSTEQEQTQHEVMMAVESMIKRAHRRRTIAHMGVYSVDPRKRAEETTDGIEMQQMMEPSSSPSRSAQAHAGEEAHLLNAKKADDSESDS